MTINPPDIKSQQQHVEITDDHMNDQKKWTFPFPPYSIQTKFMAAMYSALNQKGIGIFESPTGTGKSLSLLCGALTWINDNMFNPDVYTNPSIENGTVHNDADAPLWVRQQAVEIERANKTDQVIQFQNRVQTRIDRARQSPIPTFSSTVHPRALKKAKPALHEDSDLDELIVDYASDLDEPELNSETYEEHTIPQYSPPQIIYVSRTHSQLTQFIGEYRSSGFSRQTLPFAYSLVALASRSILCINDQVLNDTHSVSAHINDMCQALQKQSAAKNKMPGCPYLHPAAHPLSETFTNHILAKPMHIEDLVELGRSLKTCPYYGTRRALPLAHIVVMPYSSLICKDVRASLDVRIKGNIIIFDEAHNVCDAINHAHGTVLDGVMVERSHNGLGQYLVRFRNLLRPSNRVLIQQLLQLLLAIHNWLKLQRADRSGPQLMQTTQFVFNLKVDQLNLFKLVDFLRESQLSRKVLGYMDKVSNGLNSVDITAGNHLHPRHINPTTLFTDFERFLNKMVYPDQDGRILFYVPPDSSVPILQYLSLNPGSHFADLVSDAHAIVLAGGTLQPISELTDFLIPDLFGKPVLTKSFDHVVPKHHVKTLVVTKSPAGRNILCTMEGRKDPHLLEDISATISNIVNIVPQGMVVFFPSFAMLDECIQKMKEIGTIERIGRKKKVFIEPREAQTLAHTLGNYAQHLDTNETNGAILFAVVNGKMSEGINFSDHLARCVLMIGLPYPNRGSIELNEKLKYIETQKPGRSSEYYENLCMRAVNQSIGRAIRHINDYAAIVLVDVRYQSQRISSKLPQWIIRDLVTGCPFGHVIRELAQFYRSLRSLLLSARDHTDMIGCKTRPHHSTHGPPFSPSLIGLLPDHV